VCFLPAQARKGGGTLKSIRWFWLAAALTLAADLASKYVSFRALGGVSPPGHICDDACGHYYWVARNVLRFVNHYNTGGAFGWASGNLVLFLAAAAVLVPVLVLTAYHCRDPHAPLWGLGLIVGGAIGNLYDRLFHPGVRDFIEIINPRTGYALWPVFNIADVTIVVGVVVYLIWSLIDVSRSCRKSGQGGEADDAAAQQPE
jgi:signal peptidase II